MDLFLPADDPKSELLQPSQCQPSTFVGPLVRAGRDYFERLGKF
jgi:hypothetical protein